MGNNCYRSYLRRKDDNYSNFSTKTKSRNKNNKM